jgi:predicted hotdog family 3-hydroxylacyl-ACP dehydratase
MALWGTEGTAAATFGVEVTAQATAWGGGAVGRQRRDTEGIALACRKRNAVACGIYGFLLLPAAYYFFPAALV